MIDVTGAREPEAQQRTPPASRPGPVEYRPTRFAYWSRFALEFVIAAAGIAITVLLALAQAAAGERRDEQVRESRVQEIQSIEDESRAARELQILNQWLPQFLAGENPEHAERMILALNPGLAAEIYLRTRNAYESAGLLTDELAVRLDAAILGARRADLDDDPSVVSVATHSDRESAEMVAAQLVEEGLAGVTVAASGSEFVVLVRGLDSDRAALLIAETLAADHPDVQVVAESAAVTPVEVQVPDIFGLAEAEALALLGDAGFINVVVWRVPSGSVEAGRVREVVLNDGEAVSTEQEVVDENGVLVQTLPSTTPIAVKISTGPAG